MRIRFASAEAFVAFLVLAVPAFGQSSSPAKAATRNPPAAAPVPRTATPAPAAVRPNVEATKPKAFTNEDVIKLEAAGFSDRDIVDAIDKATNKAFDTSADGLISLANAGVSKPIIGVVLGRPYAPEVVPVVSPAPVAVATVAAPSETPQARTAAPGEQPEERRGGLGGVVARLNPVRRGNERQNEEGTHDAIPVPQETTKIPTPKRNDPAVFLISLSDAEACKLTIRFLVTQKNREMVQSDCSVGQISTKPAVARGLMTNQAKRAVITFVTKNGGTEVQVLAKQMGTGDSFFSTNGGKDVDDRREGVNAKESVELATELRDALLTAARIGVN